MSNHAFEPKVVAVSGGASGIGAATVERFARDGAIVLILDTDADGGERMEQQFENTVYVEVDAAEPRDIKAVVAAIARQFGGLDVLVNCAGTYSPHVEDDVGNVDGDGVFQANMRAMMVCTQAAIRPMRLRGAGAIVNVTSIAGGRHLDHTASTDTTSKNAVLGFTRHCAAELAAANIRVTAVCAGPTRIPAITRTMPAEALASTVDTIPLGRWIEPDEVANAIHFLASPAASMCTGTSIDVDGGVRMAEATRHSNHSAA